jgi:hypothetical protein
MSFLMFDQNEEIKIIFKKKKNNSNDDGKILNEGKIGFRQMQWTHFAYRNFKVWELQQNK